MACGYGCTCPLFVMPPDTVQDLEAGFYHKHAGCPCHHRFQECPTPKEQPELALSVYEGKCQNCPSKTGPGGFFYRIGGNRVELCAGCGLKMLGELIGWRRKRDNAGKARARSGT